LQKEVKMPDNNKPTPIWKKDFFDEAPTSLFYAKLCIKIQAEDQGTMQN
jgi:hypothetical protein